MNNTNTAVFEWLEVHIVNSRRLIYTNPTKFENWKAKLSGG